MIEEIKIDNNCIVKAFENCDISILQENCDNKKVYYFKANDIAKALNISQIRSSIQNFDEDEKVVRKVNDLRGCEQDTTFLSSQGVYHLLYNSKKEIAKKFRKWAGNILDDIIFNESKELKRQLEEKDKLHQIELDEKEKELTRTKKQLEQKTKLKVKKWYDSEPGHTVYAVKIKESDLIKIGKTKNIKDRERNYIQDMFYMKKCYNCDLAEQLIHHMLDKYREENNKEYFEIKDDLAIYTIDIVCDFMDKFINYSEELPNSNIKENLNISLELISNKSKENKKPIQTTIELLKLKIPDINYNKNPIDFQKFIDECCELNEEYYTSPFDLLGCYRLWSRGEMTNKTKHLFSDYMKEKFQFKDKFIAEYGSRFCVYLGIRPKLLEFKLNNQNILTKYEEFFIDKCHTGYSFRIRYSTFIDTYKEWLKNTYPNINYTKDDEIEIKAYFNKKFLLSRINMDGARGVAGLWGFQLKTDKYPKYGFQTRLRKVVYMIDLESKTLINTYESLLDSSDKIKISNRTLSDYIKLQKPFDYCNKKVILTYTKE